MHRAYTVVVFVILASLDNVAIGLVPPLYDPIGAAFGVPEGAIAAVTAATYLVTAVAAVGWAYAGDRFRRRPLLVIGTLLWAVGTGGSGFASDFAIFTTAQLIGAIGLGQHVACDHADRTRTRRRPGFVQPSDSPRRCQGFAAAVL